MPALKSWTFGLALLGIAFAAPARAQSVPAPHLAVDDTWTFHHTAQDKAGWHDSRAMLTVRRVSADEIVVATKPAGSDLPAVEKMFRADWSRERSVNGRETVVNQPLAFPLRVGKTWEIDYTENNPNRQHASEHFVHPYKVTGWEDVTVPAGTFRALKIESEGEWSAVVAPALGTLAGSRVDASGATTVMQSQRTTPHTVSGRMYKAFWYVPAVKIWVKSTEEFYDSNNARSGYYVDELESYKVAN